jgi:ferredoxin
VLDDLATARQLPCGRIDVQDGGFYRLVSDDHAGWFDHVVGPHSLKRYLFPPREIVLQAQRQPAGWSFQDTVPVNQRLAVIGLRGCDLAALRIQDRVFLEGPYVDQHYAARRKELFVVAVNCRRAAATCFCHSMGTGPQAGGGYDLAISELTSKLVVQIGTPRGSQVLASVPWSPCPADEAQDAHRQTAQLADQLAARETIPARPVAATATASARADGASDAHRGEGADAEPRGRALDAQSVHDLLLANLDHPRWDQVAERCLACGNCTLVCPTCFCSSVEEVADLTGDHVERWRGWSSCFTAEHSYISSGVVRPTTRSRYRQWLTHKLATWIDQYGTSGCVGCGRCITWCPVGIDLTEEVAALSREVP